ncbi:LOW QUALITY PROTEIN: fatty acid-binding protein, muscle [Bemisia tabaci]|uniref:LOW QUALITY PROTEIN: fatty acid-binding protein, muscle n=1 Tax=Bemisia tabaci TaxID=7038 RepID=UPI003B283AA6
MYPTESAASGAGDSRLRPSPLLRVAVTLLVLQCAVDYCLAASVPTSAKQDTNMVDQYLNKKYKLDSSENFEEIMKALGVGLFTRKVGAAVSPVMELTKDGDTYTLTSKSTFKDTTTNFKLGEEFDEETPDGRNVKSVITQEGNKLIQIQKGDKVTKIVREFTPEEVKMVLTVDDITCTRIYKPY